MYISTKEESVTFVRRGLLGGVGALGVRVAGARLGRLRAEAVALQARLQLLLQHVQLNMATRYIHHTYSHTLMKCMHHVL